MVKYAIISPQYLRGKMTPEQKHSPDKDGSGESRIPGHITENIREVFKLRKQESNAYGHSMGVELGTTKEDSRQSAAAPVDGTSLLERHDDLKERVDAVTRESLLEIVESGSLSPLEKLSLFDVVTHGIENDNEIFEEVEAKHKFFQERQEKIRNGDILRLFEKSIRRSQQSREHYFKEVRILSLSGHGFAIEFTRGEETSVPNAVVNLKFQEGESVSRSQRGETIEPQTISGECFCLYDGINNTNWLTGSRNLVVVDDEIKDVKRGDRFWELQELAAGLRDD